MSFYRKNPIFVFFFSVLLLITGLISFMQSPGFANWVKRIASRYVPQDIGVVADFRDFSVKLFPPGISINQIRVEAKKAKISQLPEGAILAAERLDLVFLPLQILSGNILVNQVSVVNGELYLPITQSYLDSLSASSSKKKSKTMRLRWDELFQVRAESIGLENVRLRVKLPEQRLDVSALARQFNLAQWKGKGGVGYQLKIDIDSIQGSEFGPIEKWMKGKTKLLSQLRFGGEAKVNQLGATLNQLLLQFGEVSLEGKGKIDGNILTQKNLPSEFSFKLSSQIAALQEIAQQFIEQKFTQNISGALSSESELKFDLLQPERTLISNFKIHMNDFRSGHWYTQSLTTSGGVDLREAVPKLHIDQLIAESPQLPRIGGSKAGSGGKLVLGHTNLLLTKADQQIELPLELTQLHLHWITGPATKSLYPLSFRATGPLKLNLDIEDKDWSLTGDAKLNIADLLLDNQRLGKVKPQRDVLRIKDEVAINSQFSINSESVEIQNALLGVTDKKGRTLTGVVKGSIDFEEGFDLHAQLVGELGTIGKLAEAPISGSGQLKIHAHGPQKRVLIDFEPDLADATYLNLNLGRIVGKITLDEDPTLLLIKDLNLLRGETHAIGNGVLDLGKEDETIDVKVDVKKATVEDSVAIFSNLTEDIWWFPSTMTGNWSGAATLTGGLSLAQLSVHVEGAGTGWEYWSERFSEVNFSGGYDRGHYLIQNFSGKKRTGSIHGRIHFDGKKQMSWNLSTEQLKLGDLDHVARLEIPVKGSLRVESQGEGVIGSLKSKTIVELAEVVVRGTSYPSSKIEAQSDGGLFQSEGYFLGAQASGKLIYSFLPGVPSELHLRANQLDFSPVLLLLNSQLIQDAALRGTISGKADLSFKSGDIERSTGEIALTNYVLRKTGVNFELKNPWEFAIKRGSFVAPIAQIASDAGTSTLELTADEAQLEGSIKGELGIGLIEFFTPVISRARGAAQLNFGVGGTLKKPDLMGTLGIVNGSVFVPAIEAPIENITGSIGLKQSRVTIQSLDGDLSKGKVKLEGGMELFADRFPKLDLSGTVLDSRIKVFPFQFAKVRGRFDVKGEALPYLISGRFVIDSALLKEKMLNTSKAQGLKTARFTPPSTSGQKGDQAFFRLNLDVIAEKGVIIQNDVFDAEGKGTVKILNTLEAPRSVGKGELIQGKILFKDRAFQIQSAQVEFDNPTTLNPKFNLLSSTDVNGTKVQMYASGRMDSYKIELSSNPVMSETDILSLLAIGVTKDDLKKLSSNDRGLVEQGEGINLLLHSLDFNRDVQDKTGFQVEIDEAVNSQTGNNIFRPRTDTDVTTSAAPKIVIKRQIIKNKVDVSVGSTVGVGTSRQQQMNAEWKVTPGMSVIGVWDQVEMNDTTGTRRQSYGVDLKFQKRFK